MIWTGWPVPVPMIWTGWPVPVPKIWTGGPVPVSLIWSGWPVQFSWTELKWSGWPVLFEKELAQILYIQLFCDVLTPVPFHMNWSASSVHENWTVHPGQIMGTGTGPPVQILGTGTGHPVHMNCSPVLLSQNCHSPNHGRMLKLYSSSYWSSIYDFTHLRKINNKSKSTHASSEHQQISNQT